MFRSLFRRSRTIRVPVEDSGHQVRQVRLFRTPLSKPSNFISTFFIAYVVFRILESYTVSKKSDKGDDSWETWQNAQGLNATGQQDHQLSEHWKKAHEAFKKANAIPEPTVKPGDRTDGLPPDVISTITLPIWIRARQSPPYQPDDPEYKDYVRIQSDKKKVAELEKEVGEWVVTKTLKAKMHKDNLQHIGFNGQVAILLDLVPQLHPPPVYEVPAVILFKDGVGLGWKVLRPDLGSKMDTIMRPTATYRAAKASIKVFFSTAYVIAKARFFGGNPAIVQLGASKPPNSLTSQKDFEKANAIPPISHWPVSTQATEEWLRAFHNSQNTRERHKELVKNAPFSLAVRMAAATFRSRQLHDMMLHQQNRARGVIYVRGAVVCIGGRGDYRLDVQAFYLPSEDRFLGALIVRSAYIVKDFSQLQKLEDQKKKKLLDAKNERQQSQPRPKPADDHHDAPEKPATGKEKE